MLPVVPNQPPTKQRLDLLFNPLIEVLLHRGHRPESILAFDVPLKAMLGQSLFLYLKRLDPASVD
jgi:hypothetical protein